MKPLSKELRNKFERTIENAREIAEEAARIALEQLGVGEASPYSYLSEDERALRRRLRAHGRNLGDVRDPKTETQEIDRLVEEIAYEHWHRMLFARFLAENDLLMYYEDDDIENSVPVTLSECDELSQELGMKNGWEVASKLATKMLPQVFRADSPVFKVELPPEKQKHLENLVSSIEGDVFKASDSLGWTYQFWQNKKKEVINKSEVKIGDKELPVVTQLFTEPYMVDFLVDNYIGAWFYGKSGLLKKDSNYDHEESIRDMLKIDDIKFDYLRLIKNENNKWETLIDSRDFPDELSNLKILDPSCGSGHFLISIFLKLVPLRMLVEKLDPRSACEKVIQENIHGLEIDKRCVEIAVFSIALLAWKYPNAGGYRRLPNMNIAWCGQPFNLSKSELLRIAGNDNNLEFQLSQIYELLEHASILGSLINPKKVSSKSSMFHKKWNYLEIKILTKLTSSDETDDFRVIARGINKSLELLTKEYNWVVTNVPYLGIRKQNNVLRSFIEKNYYDSRHDLSTVFLNRCEEFVKSKGIIQVVIPSSWLFSYSYITFRKRLLNENMWISISKIGTGGFDTISGEVVNVILLTIKKKFQDNYLISYIDVSDQNSIIKKSKKLIDGKIEFISKSQQLKNPDSRVILDHIESFNLLEEFADSLAGIQNGDSLKFLRSFWETNDFSKRWIPIQMAVNETVEFGGLNTVIDYDIENGHLREIKEIRRVKLHDSDQRGKAAWNKRGVLVSRMGSLPATAYYGNLFDQNSAVILPKNDDYLLPIIAFCQSTQFSAEVRKIDNKLNVTNSTLTKVPFDFDFWKKVSEKKYPQGYPKPYTDDPTQWIFHGHPRKSIDPLQVAVARLLGYRWPAELDDEMELSDEARELIVQSQSLLPYADKDGIVCIPSVRGEAPASERLLNLLAAAYKDEDINMILAELLSNADHAGKSLESWLRDKFFTQHYKLFGHRPFIWQIWDGLKDGFSVLVNYHKLDRKNLETLIYTYLGDWISKQKSAMMDGIEGAEEKLNAAISLKKKLELILEGESPYDIFVRWKPLNEQPLGWEPDLNDGVRVNIRPFMLVEDVGKKGAGVLRDKPNIKWNKDRGKDTENSPWYHLFGGDRINDHHLTLEEKKKAREDEVKFR